MDSCDICASSSRPVCRRRISLSHVNKAFNSSIQACFLSVYIYREKYEVLNVIDTGTNYGERTIVPKKEATTMKEKLETEWLCHHGAPEHFSADPEFCRPIMNKFLESHNIKMKSRPARSSYKNEKVERNNGVFKSILSKICKERT